MFPDLTRDDVFRIETPRLWLRWPTIADVAAISDFAGDKQVADMTANVPHPYPPGAAETFIFEARKSNALGKSLSLGLSLKRAPHELIGLIRASLVSDDAYDLGYMLHRAHWRQGLATEAVQALIDAVFTLTDACEARAGVRVINPASRRVLEKSGFQMSGSGLDHCPARGGRLPCDHFRLGRRTWNALKGWRAPSFDRISIDVGIAALEASASADQLGLTDFSKAAAGRTSVGACA